VVGAVEVVTARDGREARAGSFYEANARGCSGAKISDSWFVSDMLGWRPAVLELAVLENRLMWV